MIITNHDIFVNIWTAAAIFIHIAVDLISIHDLQRDVPGLNPGRPCRFRHWLYT